MSPVAVLNAFSLFLKSGFGAPFPERVQCGSILWRRCGLIPVQRVRVVSWGSAESLHQYSHQDKTRTPGLKHPTNPFQRPHVTFYLQNCPSLPKSTPTQPPRQNPPTTTTNPNILYQSISRGLFTSLALQNFNGECRTKQRERKSIGSKVFHFL